EESAGLRQLWRWHRTGAHEAWFLESNCWKECDIAGLLAHRVLRKGAQVFRLGRTRARQPQARTRTMMRAMRVVGRYGPPVIRYTELSTPTVEVWSHWLDNDNRQPIAPRTESDGLKIVQYAGALYPGGAERQLCNLSAGLLRRGHKVLVLTTDDLEGERGHY